MNLYKVVTLLIFLRLCCLQVIVFLFILIIIFTLAFLNQTHCGRKLQSIESFILTLALCIVGHLGVAQVDVQFGECSGHLIRYNILLKFLLGSVLTDWRHWQVFVFQLPLELFFLINMPEYTLFLLWLLSVVPVLGQNELVALQYWSPHLLSKLLLLFELFFLQLFLFILLGFFL